MAEIGLDTGLLDEHAPRNREDGKGSQVYTPNEAEQKAIRLAEQLYSKAKKHRSLYDKNWTRYYRMFRGDQWDKRRPSYRHGEVINHIFKTIQSVVPIQTDSRPRFEFLPEEPSDLPLAEALNQAAESDWSKHNWALELLEVIYDANIYGAGISSLLHEPKENYGAGKICYKSADPLYFYPDPDALDVNKKCCFVVYAEPMDVKKIKRMYPGKKDYIKPDLVDLAMQGKTDLSKDLRQLPNDGYRTQTDSGTDMIDKDRALLITVWITAEHLQEDFDEKQGDDGEFTQVAKWPNGRKIVICNKVLLEDGPNPYEDGKIPFQRLLNYVLPREFWGISEVEQLEGPQKTFNKILNFALDVMTLMGNPIWINDNTSGVDSDNLVNRPGLVVEKNPGTEVNRVEGVQLQPYVLQLADKMAEWFNEIGPSQDVSRGIQPTGITAASAITSLQEAAQTRLRLKARLLDYYLQDLGQMWCSRTFQYRTAPEMFRLTNKQGMEQYFRMHVEDYEKTETVEEVDGMGQPAQKVVPTGEMGRRMIVQPYEAEGGYDLQKQQVYEVRGQMDVRVVTGSSLPFAKAEKEQKLLNFFDRGIIDEQEVLKGSDYPNWEAVLQRIEQKKQAAAQAELAAKAPAGGQPPAA